MDDRHETRRWVRGAVGVAIAVWGLCLVGCVGLGAALILRGELSVPWAAATGTPAVGTTATQSPTRAARATALPVLTQTPLPALTPGPANTATPTALPTAAPTPAVPAPANPTPTPAASAATQAPTATQTSAPVATRTSTPAAPTPAPTALAATRTPTPTLSASAPTALATPIVCNDLDQVGQLTIVPGQRFSCTIGQQDLTARVNQQPDVPCTDLEVTFAGGEIGLTCSMGIKLRATGVVQVEDCRVSIRIVKGTIGFTQVVQGLIDQYVQLVPEDLICIEEATVGDGVIKISGYGR